MRDHLLLLGWNDHSERALAEIRRDPRHQARRVLIVADLDRGPVDGVDFVRGEPSQAEVLERASAPHAAAALIFARDPNDPRSDHETALCALSLRRLNPDAKVAAELVSPTNTTHLENAGCDSIIDGAALVADLLVRSVNETGFDRVVDRIVHPTGAATLFQLEGARFAGKGWREVAAALLDEGLTLLAISRGRGSYEMAAEATEPLHADDVLYVFGREPK